MQYLTALLLSAGHSDVTVAENKSRDSPNNVMTLRIASVQRHMDSAARVGFKTKRYVRPAEVAASMTQILCG